MKLQADENLVEYDSNGSPTWATNTFFLPSDSTATDGYLILDSNGGLNLHGKYADGRSWDNVVW